MGKITLAASSLLGAFLLSTLSILSHANELKQYPPVKLQPLEPIELRAFLPLYFQHVFFRRNYLIDLGMSIYSPDAMELESLRNSKNVPCSVSGTITKSYAKDGTLPDPQTTNPEEPLMVSDRVTARHNQCDDGLGAFSGTKITSFMYRREPKPSSGIAPKSATLAITSDLSANSKGYALQVSSKSLIESEVFPFRSFSKHTVLNHHQLTTFNNGEIAFSVAEDLKMQVSLSKTPYQSKQHFVFDLNITELTLKGIYKNKTFDLNLILKSPITFRMVEDKLKSPSQVYAGAAVSDFKFEVAGVGPVTHNYRTWAYAPYKYSNGSVKFEFEY